MTESFYNQLAPFYKFIFSDWDASVKRHAAQLDGVIREYFGEVNSILDAACGIGTQSLGLAQLGYQVTASDLSPHAVGMARAEAQKRGLNIIFDVADMRRLWQVHQQTYDVVIACDNAIPHLLSDREILGAFEQFHRCTAPGGGCIISVRDYEDMEKGGRVLYPRTTTETPDGKIVIFDLWEFEGECYEITTYITEDKGGETATTQVLRGARYYCVTIPTLESLFRQAGFTQVVTLRDRYFQPLLVARK